MCPQTFLDLSYSIVGDLGKTSPEIRMTCMTTSSARLAFLLVSVSTSVANWRHSRSSTGRSLSTSIISCQLQRFRTSLSGRPLVGSPPTWHRTKQSVRVLGQAWTISCYTSWAETISDFRPGIRPRSNDRLIDCTWDRLEGRLTFCCSDCSFIEPKVINTMFVPFQHPFQGHRFDQPLLFLHNFIFRHEVGLWALSINGLSSNPALPLEMVASSINGWRLPMMLGGSTMDKAMSFHNKRRTLCRRAVHMSVRGGATQRMSMGYRGLQVPLIRRPPTNMTCFVVISPPKNISQLTNKPIFWGT